MSFKRFDSKVSLRKFFLAFSLFLFPQVTMIFCISFFSTLSIVSSTIIPFTFDRFHNPRFLAEYILEDLEQVIPGYVSLLLDQNQQYTSYHNATNHLSLRYQGARGVRIVSGTDLLFPNYIHMLRVLNISYSHMEPSVMISASLSSPFAQTIQNFLISPNSESEGILVLHPTNPNQYALDETLYYAPISEQVNPFPFLPHLPNFAVTTAIRFLYPGISPELPFDTALRFQPCRIGSTNSDLALPRSIMDEFIGIAVERGVAYSDHSLRPSAYIQLHNVTDTDITLFPSLQFLVRTDNNQTVSIAHLSPHDYMQRIDPNSWRIGISQGEHECFIHNKFTKNLVIHYDVLNRRIGFGEPINAF